MTTDYEQLLALQEHFIKLRIRNVLTSLKFEVGNMWREGDLFVAQVFNMPKSDTTLTRRFAKQYLLRLERKETNDRNGDCLVVRVVAK